jgi:hypothetical protein
MLRSSEQPDGRGHNPSHGQASHNPSTSDQQNVSPGHQQYSRKTMHALAAFMSS